MKLHYIYYIYNTFIMLKIIKMTKYIFLKNQKMIRKYFFRCQQNFISELSKNSEAA